MTRRVCRLAVALGLGVAACGGSPTGSTDSLAPADATTQPDDDATVPVSDRPSIDGSVLRSDDLAGGFRLTADVETGCGGPLDAKVELIDPATGDKVWAQEAPFPSAGGLVNPPGSDDVMYVSPAVGWESLQGGGFALVVSDGSPVWQRDDDRAVSQAVVGDLLLEQTDGGEIRAVDAVTGSELWVQPGSTLASGPPPDISESGAVLLTGWPESNDVFALDRHTGDELWRYDAETEPLPVGGDDGLFVVLYPNVIVRLDAASGEELWRFDAGEADASFEDIDFADDRMVVTASVQSATTTTSRWFVLDRTTGKVRAQQSAPSTYGQGDFTAAPLAPFAFGDLIVTGKIEGATGSISAVDPASGQQRWNVSVPDPRARLVAGDMLLVAHRAPPAGPVGDGIVAIDGNGVVRWSWASDSHLEPRTLATSGDLVVVGLSDDGSGGVSPRGGLIAFDRSTGEVAWTVDTSLPATTIINTESGLVVVTQEMIIGCG
jgi:outer membrane protein assembly factor BamB